MDKDVLKAWFANGGVLAVVTMAQAELALKIVLLLLTIAYTLRKWWIAETRPKQKPAIDEPED
jgi:hypothetical protein